jgi:phosphate transport system permease protein
LAENNVLRLGIETDIANAQITGIVWSQNATVTWLDLRSGKAIGSERLHPPSDGPKSTLRKVDSLGAGRYSLTWSNGSVSLVEIGAARSDQNPSQATRHLYRTLASIPAIENADALYVCASGSESGAITRAARQSDGTLAIHRQVTSETPLGDEEVSTYHAVLRDEIAAHIRAMALDGEGRTLYAGTDDGRLIRWQLDEKGQVAEREVVRALGDGRAITALALVLGDVSLAVGDAKGGLSIWSPVNTDGTRKLKQFHQLQRHPTAIRQILPSGRNKSILSVSDDGVAHLDHTTSERRLLSVAAAQGKPLRQIALSPRGDALCGLDASGALTAWSIDNAHPEISLTTLFGKVQYEGYDSPEYAWQTTGGEDFEPKFSLAPLLFGTLKGTLYAMIFAVPLALFGAMYISYFTTPAVRRTIKPVIEIMATVPSVVIGFLIALWLAPIIERWVLAGFISLIVVPITLVGFVAIWRLLRRFDWTKRVENRFEFLVIWPVLILGAGLAVWLTGPIETWLFEGNFRRWLFEGPLAMQYDQRNCIIIAFGLGFTVIPIIFSLAEDSLSNVPYSLTAASMAIGASRWQTLWRVVLPSASPGIFAAIMIGFGRAVGETMIVLMATGNTPILDWSPFNGMRTLSANIAVEIPEAPVGGTLYRVLFLCAVLLFLLTFTVNTVAELVRQRLRKRFGQF